jgi:hypothetical protein
MGRQKSVNTLAGRVGTFSYYKSRDGMMARDKQGLEGKRIMTDENYERVREHLAEFGRAVKAAKELRLALSDSMKRTADRKVANRLSKLFNQIVKSDPVSVRGGRLASLGDLGSLHDFEFNVNQEMKMLLKPEFYTPTIDRATGQASITVQPFIPKMNLAHPQAANHFKFLVCAVEIDFDNLVHTRIIANSASLPIDMNPTPALDLVAQLPAQSTQCLILAFGILFEDLVNGIAYPLNDTSRNALAIKAVDFAE